MLERDMNVEKKYYRGHLEIDDKMFAEWMRALIEKQRKPWTLRQLKVCKNKCDIIVMK